MKGYDYDCEEGTQHDADEGNARHTRVPAADFSEGDWEGEKEQIKEAVHEGEIYGTRRVSLCRHRGLIIELTERHEDDDRFRKHHNQGTNQSNFDGLGEGLLLEFLESTVLVVACVLS